LLPNVVTNEICDLGFLDENSKQFKLSHYVEPNNFRGVISSNEAMRVGLKMSAEDFESKSLYVLEISWDGQWSSDLNEMKQHLVTK